MIGKLHKMMEEADAICTYNGDKFDVPTVNKDFLVIGFTPPSPSKGIDLLKVVKKNFRFPSNKLAYVAEALGLGQKTAHSGHELWVACGKKDKEAWKVMEEYNIQDVLLLEKLYDKLKPWIKGTANHSVHNDTGECCCPSCGSLDVQKRGFYYTIASKFQRYRCTTCGNWFKDSVVLNRKLYKTSSI